MELRKCDVLVIGAGGAALRSAVAAHDRGATVIIAVKDKLGSGATSYRVSEMAAYNVADGVADPGDGPEAYFNDIMTASNHMADPEVARVVAENSVDSLRHLREWGVPFEMENGRYYAYKGCFSTRPRTHVIKGHGDPIIEALLREVAARGIESHEYATIVSLVVRDGVCGGAVGVGRDGKPILFSAGAVVLATGGSTQMFRRNMNPTDVTGDGCAMAHRAGADLVNLEFMQAGPGFVFPNVSLINAYVWGGHPVLTNSLGERFMDSLPNGVTANEAMDEHRKHFPFSASDNSLYLEVSIQKEVAEGRGTENGGVHADFTMMTDDYVRGLSDEYGIHHMWKLAKEYYYQRGVRLLEEKVEVGCFGHASNGGVKIDANARSSIPGLYAAGETAGGPHGADRLGGNMMVTCQVFGKVSGESAAAFSRSADARACGVPDGDAALEAVLPLLRRKLDADAILMALRNATQRDLLVRRTDSGLRRLQGVLDTLEGQLDAGAASDTFSLKNMEAANLVLMAKLTAQTALRRKETRGSHYREDFPATSPEFDAPIVIEKA